MATSAEDGFEPWADKDIACVFISAQAWDELDLVDDRKCAKVLSLLSERYAVFGPQNLDQEKLNTEGRKNIEGKNVLVLAFKAGQVRLYGAEGNYNGKRAFFATHAVTKKQQKADPKEIKKAAERAIEFVACIPGAGL